MHAKISSNNALTSLIDNTRHVGFIVSIDFEEAVILTNDYWKEEVAGIPANSFLVAASFLAEDYVQTPQIDREVILLRVLGPSPLPMDGNRIQAMLDSYTKRTQLKRAKQVPGNKEIYEFDQRDGFDPYTHTELQFGALRCRIVGSFYLQNSELQLGADIENFASASHLRAYKPTDQALTKIVNFINPIRKKQAEKKARELGFPDLPEPFKIGTIRYTSSDRLHRPNGKSNVSVGVNPADFLARRTFVGGMTRTGKSNMIKTLSSAVALAGLNHGVKIGQVVFDINGEYANANSQDDGSSIAEVFGTDVVRYRGMKKEGFRDLRNNFYEEPHLGLRIIQNLLREEKLANDMSILVSSLSLDPLPDDATESESARLLRWTVAFKALLFKLRFEIEQDYKVSFSVSKAVLRQILEHELQDKLIELSEELGKENLSQKDIESNVNKFFPNYDAGVSLGEAVRFFSYARSTDRKIRNEYEAALKEFKKNGTPLPNGLWPSLRSKKQGDDWLDDELKSLTNLIVGKSMNDTPIRVKSYLGPIADYHSKERIGGVESEVYELLRAGKIVILDLSVGTEEVRTSLADRIAQHIFTNSMSTFHSGETPPNIVIYVEEAHNLIGKNAKPDETWPRIAKEGAKANLALVYATQEPSSVQPNILANTENWIITHLNNDDELRVLGKYYDFADFIQSLKRAQDVGFARIKTLSSPYVIPTQVDLFEPKLLKKEVDSIRGKTIENPSDITKKPSAQSLWE